MNTHFECLFNTFMSALTILLNVFIYVTPVGNMSSWVSHTSACLISRGTNFRRLSFQGCVYSTQHRNIAVTSPSEVLDSHTYCTV